jgi:PAS domain S-box-containing protein
MDDKDKSKEQLIAELAMLREENARLKASARQRSESALAITEPDLSAAGAPNPSDSGEISVLLIEDSEDDYIIVRSVLQDVSSSSYRLEWAPSYEEALKAIRNGGHDVCLLDYHLGVRNGLDFLEEVLAEGYRAPVILMTGQEDYALDMQAMRAGAADYLSKEQLSPTLLERAIRYAIEHKQQKDALRRVKEEWQLTFDALSDFIVILDKDRRIVRANRAFAEKLGLRPEELIGRQCCEHLHRTAAPPLFCPYTKLLADGQEHSAEFDSEVLGGNISVTTSPLRNSLGLLIGSVHIARDITGIKQAEKNIRESEERFRFIAETTEDVIYRLKYSTMTYDYLSPAITKLTGYSPQEINAMGFSAIVRRIERPGEKDVRPEAIAQEREEGKTGEFRADYLVYIRDGSLKWLRDHSFPWLDESSRVVGSVGILSDVTELKEAEESLRKSEQKFRMLVETMNEGLGVQDEHGVVTYVNDKLCEMLGYAREELLGIPSVDLLGATDRDRFIPEMRAMRVLSRRSSTEINLKAKDGSRVSTITSSSPIYDVDGRYRGVIAAITDITRRKQMEEALQESERQLRYLSSQLLEVQENERKRFANEIHDGIGQTLHAVKVGLESLLGQTKQSGDRRLDDGLIEELALNVEFAIEEVRSIYMDLRPSLLDDLGILATMKWFLREFRRVNPQIAIETYITIQEDEAPDPLKVTVFRVLQEAMENIVRHSGAGFVKIYFMRNNNIIELIVEDNGQGFDLASLLSGDTLNKGVGLYSMQERVESSGGIFTVKSNKGAGTTVRAAWPAS